MIAGGVTAFSLLALLALPPAGAGASKSAGLGIPMPKPGHVSFAVASAEVRAGKPNQLPKSVVLGFPKAKKLPSSVRVVWATRVIRKGKRTTFAAAVVVVNQAGSGDKRGRALAGKGGEDGPVVGPGYENLLWDMFVASGGAECSGRCHEMFPENELNNLYECDSCSRERHPVLESRKHVDEGSTADQRKTLKDLFEDVKSGENGELAFEPGNNDRTLETGDYDNGRGFGWDVKTRRDERAVLTEIALAVLNREEGNLVGRLESVAGVDLNGDGVVASGGDGSGSFTRHQQCEFVTDPPNCTYLSAAVSFDSSFRAFQIEIPGYRVQPGELTAVYNEGGAEVGSCSPLEPRVVHCNLNFALGGGAVVNTQVEPATEAQPEGVRLSNGHGGLLFEAEPSPSTQRVGGPFAITGP